MSRSQTILIELQELESRLAGYLPQRVYSVPEGYFDSLADQILSRIKSGIKDSAREELGSISPLVSNISKQSPYSVPAGYFDRLDEKIMSVIRNHADYQTAKEELNSISPVLSSMNKKIPFQVPDGYFENLNPETRETKKSKVVSFKRRRLMRMAAAAIITSVIVLGGLMTFNQKKIDPVENPDGWIAKNVNKKISEEKLDEFITLTEIGNITGLTDEVNPVETDEIRELIKDIPDNEIDELLNDAVAFQSNVINSESLNME